MALSRLSSSLLILLATSTLLTACDLNGDDSDPTTNAAPSSETPAAPTTSSYLTGVRRAQADDSITTELVLVDDVTGTEVKTTRIDTNTQPKLAQAFTVAADGKGRVAGRQTAAYYVFERKLYEISLEHVSNELSQPTARQVNSETQVCELSKVAETDGTAHTSLLSYSTAGADGDCSTLDDNLDKTALSTGGDAAVQTVQLVDVKRDSSGAISRVLGLKTANDKSSLVSASASTLQVTSVINGDLAAGLPAPTDPTASKRVSVSVFSKIATAPDKVYLLVGNQVRQLDWSTDTLGTSALATLEMAPNAIVHTDDEATYFLNVQTATATSYELALWRIKPSQVVAEKVSSLSIGAAEDLPEIDSHVMTPSSLALVARHNGADTLTIIKKANGSQRNIALSGPTLHIDTLAHAGDILLVSQQLVTGEDTASVTRIDLANNDALSILSTSASLVTFINNPNISFAGEADNTYLIWREGSNVLSYNLNINATPITIADSSTLNGWDGSTLKASVSNLTQGLLRGISTLNANAEALWLFNANKAAAVAQR